MSTEQKSLLEILLIYNLAIMSCSALQKGLLDSYSNISRTLMAAALLIDTLLLLPGFLVI